MLVLLKIQELDASSAASPAMNSPEMVGLAAIDPPYTKSRNPQSGR
jgi:hypothetical protein